MAARRRLGGLADADLPGGGADARACFDWVLVETVGVGQSETEIADCADLVLLCVQPGSGDALQFMKAGIMEVPDLVLVTKGDLGAPADRAAGDLRGALSLAAGRRPAADGRRRLRRRPATASRPSLDLIAACRAAAATLPPRGARAQVRAWARAPPARIVRTRSGEALLAPRLSDRGRPVRAARDPREPRRATALHESLKNV